MNAVNLIPSDRRGRRRSVSASPPTLALLGGLLLVLVAAVVYVSAVKDVRAKRSQLARVTAAASAWNAAAARFDATVQEVQQRSQELTDVKQLAAGRFPWSELLSQIGGLMPADAGLTSMQATTTPGATPSAAPTPTIQLAGCAASQSAVAQTMVQLHRVTGVTGVSLSSSTQSGGTGGGSASTGASTTSGCGFPVQFQLTMTFTPATSTSATSGGGMTSTPASTTGTASTASAPTTTGAAQ